VLYCKEQCSTEAEPEYAQGDDDEMATATATTPEIEDTGTTAKGEEPETSNTPAPAINTSETICEDAPDIEMETTEGSAFAAIPVGIILSTDGLFNSFAKETHLETFLRFNRRVLGNMEPSIRNDFSKKLETHLNERSEKGSRDDISIALIFNNDMDFEAMQFNRNPMKYPG